MTANERGLHFVAELASSLEVAAAFMTPALKTAPDGYDSIEEAEAGTCPKVYCESSFVLRPIQGTRSSKWRGGSSSAASSAAADPRQHGVQAKPNIRVRLQAQRRARREIRVEPSNGRERMYHACV
jgi:hypothetical protein